MLETDLKIINSYSIIQSTVQKQLPTLIANGLDLIKGKGIGGWQQEY
jgi:hypothetical protein